MLFGMRSARTIKAALSTATALAAFIFGGTPTATAADTDQGHKFASTVITTMQSDGSTRTVELHGAAATQAAKAADALVQPRSASGYDYFGNFSFVFENQTLTVPACSFGHYITGSGKKIEDEKAWTTGVACDLPGVTFCNWRINFAYADTSGSTYKTSTGKLHTTCNPAANVYRYNAPQTLPHYGKACAKLIVAAKQRAQQCHNITS